MGGKHSRQRKHIFLHLACWLILSFVGAGCSPRYLPYKGEPFPFYKEKEASQLLLQSETSFAEGDFLTSFKKSQEILTRFPQIYGDHALYIMGLIYADPDYIYANYEISIHYFDRLVKDYPESAFKNKAKIWLRLLNQNINYAKMIDEKNKEIDLFKNEVSAQKKQINSLVNQINQLKEIDLGIEEKKRESLPSVHP